MLSTIHSLVVAIALVLLLGCLVVPLLKFASRQVRRQGLVFVLIGAGFLSSMATKPGPSKTEVPIAKPVKIADSLLYSGLEQEGVASIDSRLTVTGTTKAKDVGEYTATFKLPADTADKTYVWEDGSKDQYPFTWQIEACDVTASPVAFAEIPDQTYTGSAIEPPVTMTINGITCTEGTDYTLAYGDNVEVGEAKVFVTGKGNFSEGTSLTFNVVDASAPEVVCALVGETIACKLADLGVEIPDTGKVTVKVEGLPKGLKYKNGVIEGTPTETLDFATQTMFARVATQVGKSKTETLQPVRLQIDAECQYTNKLGVAIEPVALSDVKSASGLPSGLKFAKGIVTGTAKKAGVFTVKLTMNDKSRRNILWQITADDVQGVLKSVSWNVEDCAVSVMQGVLQGGWTVDVPTGAKVAISGLPTGLKYKDGKISGTPTKAGNFVVTFKTVQNGVTVTERVSIIVEANSWTGNWYGVQAESYVSRSLNAVATVSANGKVKLVLQLGSAGSIVKSTFAANSLDVSGTTATVGAYLLDFANGALIDGSGKIADLCETAVSTAVDKSVLTYALEEITEGETNAYATVTATYNAKKNLFALAGKLWDGTAVKGSSYALDKQTESGGLYLAPLLLKDKAKNAVYLEFSDDGSHVRVLENGEQLEIDVSDWVK